MIFITGIIKKHKILKYLHKKYKVKSKYKDQRYESCGILTLTLTYKHL